MSDRNRYVRSHYERSPPRHSDRDRGYNRDRDHDRNRDREYSRRERYSRERYDDQPPRYDDRYVLSNRSDSPTMYWCTSQSFWFPLMKSKDSII